MLQPNVTHIYNTYAHIYVYIHTYIYIYIWTPANGHTDVVWDWGGAALV
jgi:hypothetical protein